MADVWKKAEEAVEVSADTGDILSVLERVFKQYERHRGRLINRADKQQRGFTYEERRGVEYYTEAGNAVIKLLTSSSTG